MPPASRVGDLTAHGTPLSGGGSDDVYVGGMPAWRVASDVHRCPLVTGAQPHVGGPAVTGSSTVLVNGVPIARVGDTIQEAVGANTIISGASTVIVDTGTTGLASSASGSTESTAADGTAGTPEDDGSATPPPTETLTPTPTATPTSTAPPTRERYEITDSTYTVEGEKPIFYNLPAAATVFLSFSSLDGSPVAIFTLPESDVRTLHEDPDRADTVPGLTFRETTEGSGQADLEAGEWALVMRSLAPAEDGDVPETRLHLSLSVAWIDGPPSG